MTKREREILSRQLDAMIATHDAHGVAISAMQAMLEPEEEEPGEKRVVCPTCSSPNVVSVPGTDTMVCERNHNFRGEEG